MFRGTMSRFHSFSPDRVFLNNNDCSVRQILTRSDGQNMTIRLLLSTKQNRELDKSLVAIKTSECLVQLTFLSWGFFAFNFASDAP